MRALAGLLVVLAACPASPPPAREPPQEPSFPTPRAEAPPPEPAPAGAASDEDPWQAFATGDDEAPGIDGLTAQAFLAEHNAARAQHCAPPLAWSPDLAAVADQWAKNLRDRGCAFDHSGNAYGENLFAGTSGQFSAREIVGAWVDERELYDFARGGFSMQTGHFTQVVWKGTTQVGCAVATCKNMDLVVCNYDPPGNVRGGYQKHVLPRGC